MPATPIRVPVSNNSLTDKGKRGYTLLFASGLLILAKP